MSPTPSRWVHSQVPKFTYASTQTYSCTDPHCPHNKEQSRPLKYLFHFSPTSHTVKNCNLILIHCILFCRIVWQMTAVRLKTFLLHYFSTSSHLYSSPLFRWNDTASQTHLFDKKWGHLGHDFVLLHTKSPSHRVNNKKIEAIIHIHKAVW